MVLHTKFEDIDDYEFGQMVDELHHCVAWDRDDAVLPNLFYLLSAIVTQDPKALASSRLPAKGMLSTKVDKLSRGAVEDVCRELASLKGNHIESFDGKTVLSLLKSCFPKPTRRRKPSRNQLRHEASLRVIQQRRANGDV